MKICSGNDQNNFLCQITCVGIAGNCVLYFECGGYNISQKENGTIKIKWAKLLYATYCFKIFVVIERNVNAEIPEFVSVNHHN